MGFRKDCLNKVTLETCSERQEETGGKGVPADTAGRMMREDGKGGKEKPARESSVNQAKEYELYFGCFGKPLKDF